jgi:hypothetical protein
MTRPDHDALRIFTIYNNPRDVPGCIVVRAHRVLPEGLQFERGAIAFRIDGNEAAALESARHHCRSLGLTRLERSEDDDPVIVECWL